MLSLARVLKGTVAGVVTALLAASLTAPPASAAATGLPPGFQDTLVTTVSGPMDLDWTPDGRMLVINKAGQVRVYTDGSLLPTPALDLGSKLCTVGEQGLVGLAVHPGFATNHFVYLYYIYNKFNNSCPESQVDGPVGRLSRFVLADNNTIDPASEVVLMETPPRYRNHHTGGDPKFGKDGLLYVTVGDAGAQSLGWPQDLGKLAGKVVRLTDNGGIPPANPYTGTGTARCNVAGVPPSGSPAGTKCQEIFSYGLRNPFRQAVDPNASGVKYHINDVGQHTWEEISAGPIVGANYGWQLREGPCAKDSDTDCAPLAGTVDPIHWYHHGVDGGAATGAAFVPNGLWPGYDGVYLYSDYVFGKIYALRQGGPNCRLCSPPTSDYTAVEFATVPQLVSMRFGPDGALWYVSRDGSEVRRISLTDSPNRPPVAAAAATPTSGSLPLQVQFDGSNSSDPDGDTLSYEWDLDGNGTVDSTAVSPSRTYTAAGVYVATLTVRDPSGASDSATVRIDAGNRPPVPVIDTPADGARAAVGDSITLSGSASDTDEGQLPNSALTWEVELVHATHTHPFLPPTTGNNISITYPQPEDLDAARTSYLKITLTAKDTTGLSSTVTRDLRPKTADVTFATEPSGLTINAGGLSLTGPETVTSWVNYGVPASAPDQTDSAGNTWIFGSWSDGGARSHTITTPGSSATYTATFRPGSPPPTTTKTFTPVADAYVRSDTAGSNYGTRSTLRTDASPETLSYLRFDVGGIGSPVTQAKLRVFAGTGNSIGYDIRGVTNATWGETSITYGNRPATGDVVKSSGRVTAGTWTEVDVTSLVSGSGLLSLALTSTSTTATSFDSRESANDPQLVVTYGSSGLDTQPPSTPELSGRGPAVADELPVQTCRARPRSTSAGPRRTTTSA
jgi:glucose/arabinose dehydrogenase/PKD repeat protein